MGDLVVVENLSVQVPGPSGPMPILDSVSFDLGRGEALALVGESGSGKSTTARSIVGSLPARATRSGLVVVGGRDIYALGPRALREYRTRTVALIGQNPRATMNPVRRVGDFVTEAVRTNLGWSKPDARRQAANLLRTVGIGAPERVLDQYPHQLSGGMLQRVVIAAALLIEPDLIIADEPTTALDVTTQSEVMALLGELRERRGTAMLFITHDLDLAAAVCDQMLVMYAGRIVEEQASTRLQVAPQHPYTAGLASARPRVDIDVPVLRTIPGRPAAAFETSPTACGFHARCSYATEQCHQARPEVVLTPVGRVACWRSTEISDELARELDPERASGSAPNRVKETL